MVQADYASAARECAALADRASALAATGCSAFVEATTGNTESAYQRLAESLRRQPDASDMVRLWTLTRLAEMASRLGQAAAAERHFRDALALRITDNFLLAACADFLLEQGRAAEVVDLLKDHQRSDTLLLRLAVAERQLKLPAAKQHEQALAERFAAAALRGERLHLSEGAQFLLDVKQQPKAALAAAVENWKAQREPRDAKVLLEAAVAAGDPQAAAPALRWLEETRFESEHLRRLAGQLKR
jgi:predicted Zn-dependent protease